jgi:hypothetical protein
MAAIVVDLWTDIWNPKDLAKHKMKAVCMTVLASKSVWRNRTPEEEQLTNP